MTRRSLFTIIAAVFAGRKIGIGKIIVHRDDTAWMQAAIDQCALRGRRFCLPPGIYRMKGKLFLRGESLIAGSTFHFNGGGIVMTESWRDSLFTGNRLIGGTLTTLIES